MMIFLASPAIPLIFIEQYYGSNVHFQQAKKGEALFQQGKFKQALMVLEKCMFSISTDNPLFVPVKAYMSISWQKIGQYQKSFQEISSAFEKIDHMDHFNKAMVLNVLGGIKLLNRDKQSSEKLWKKALHLSEKIKNKFLMASVLNNIANGHALSKRNTLALSEYKSALAQLENMQSTLKCVILINMIRLELKNSDPGFTNLLAEKVHACIKKMPNAYDKAIYLMSLNALLQKMPLISVNDTLISMQRMHSIINQALSIGKQLNNNAIISSALGESAQLFEKQKNYPEALQLTRKAVFFAGKNYPETLYQLQWQLGRIFESMEKTKEAISLYQQSIDTMESFQHAFFMGYHNSDTIYKQKVKPVYYGYVSLLLKSYDDSGTLPTVTLKTAIKTIEQLKQAEIKNHFKDECINYYDKPSVIPDRMPEKTALFYPFSLSDRLILLTIMPQGITYKSVPVSQKKLEKWIQSLKKRFDLRTYSKLRFNKYAKDLYDWFIFPVEKDLEQQDINTIFIAAEGILQTIPFSALLDKKTNKYLMEKYAIAILPSISFINKTQQSVRSNLQKRALICGLTQARQGFATLKGIETQLKDIQRIIGGTMLINDKFTTLNLIKEFQYSTPDIIHIITHGNVGNTPDDIYLLTYNGRLSLNNLAAIIHSGIFREKPLDLLTLGACQTAIGDERFALGLAGIAFKTGAQNVIATLRPVEKNATNNLMKQFYKNCASMNFSNKAIALQKAQINLYHSEKYAHPVFWSPFILLGNG